MTGLAGQPSNILLFELSVFVVVVFQGSFLEIPCVVLTVVFLNNFQNYKNSLKHVKLASYHSSFHLYCISYSYFKKRRKTSKKPLSQDRKVMWDFYNDMGVLRPLN